MRIDPCMYILMRAHARYSDCVRDLRSEQSVRVRMRMEFILYWAILFFVMVGWVAPPVHVADTRIIFLWRTLYVSCVCVLCMNTVPARVMNEL